MAESELKLDVACPRCGTSNMPAASKCRQCFQDLSAVAPDTAPAPGLFDVPPATLALDHVVEPTRLRRAVRARRKQAGTPASPALFNLAWLLRLASVVFLFWGVIDTSMWLDKLTHTMQPEDPRILRYSLFAIYEIVRDAAIVGGVWLLTLLKPRR
jgi:hypothetical protein